MRILFYKWSVVNEDLVINNLRKLQHDVFILEGELKNYEVDAEFMQRAIFAITQQNIEALFSLNYYPILSSIAHAVGIKYYAWTQDAPSHTLYSPTLTHPQSILNIFDFEEASRLASLGAPNVFPTPLASDPDYFSKIIGNSSSHSSDICFLGNLYDKSDYNKATFQSPYEKGYADGLINAQKGIYGYDFISEMIPESLAESVIDACHTPIPEGYRLEKKDVAAYLLERRITEIERSEYLQALGNCFDLTIYTGSKPKEGIRAQYRGFADYNTTMPVIFHNAKININIAPRNIHQGTSLRVFDVLACGGFLMTSWNPNIVELFEDGKELVTFSSIEELVDKCRFFLENEEERQQIAQAGLRKIKEKYTYDIVLSQILSRP